MEAYRKEGTAVQILGIGLGALVMPTGLTLPSAQTCFRDDGKNLVQSRLGEGMCLAVREEEGGSVEKYINIMLSK